MIIAKSDLAHRRLGAALAARKVSRTYAVLTWGHLSETPLRIDGAIGRHQTDRKRMVVRPDGRAARTDLTLVARYEVAELLKAELHSGRTHQIRVHCAHIGHPVVGDPVYAEGGPRRMTGASRPLADRLDRLTRRQALHAAALRFAHPISGERMSFRCEWPADLAGSIGLLQNIAGGVDSSEWLAYLGFFGSEDG
jgi:23S rRNA pseudouridine1911/1915/1917 synthase